MPNTRSVLKISEASIIAIHAIDHMFRHRGAVSAARLSRTLGVSYNHLSKVLQRLSKERFIYTERGPKGGFVLSRRRVKIREIVELFDGKTVFADCLMGKPVCGRKKCAISRFLSETNRKYAALLGMDIKEL